MVDFEYMADRLGVIARGLMLVRANYSFDSIDRMICNTLNEAADFLRGLLDGEKNEAVRVLAVLGVDMAHSYLNKFVRDELRIVMGMPGYAHYMAGILSAIVWIIRRIEQIKSDKKEDGG